MEPKTPPAAVKLAKSLRSAGWAFLIFGSLGSIGFLVIAFRPEGSISIDGVPTTDFSKKLLVAGCSLLFPAMGSVLALTPKKKLEQCLAAFNRFARAFVWGK